MSSRQSCTFIPFTAPLQHGWEQQPQGWFSVGLWRLRKGLPRYAVPPFPLPRLFSKPRSWELSANRGEWVKLQTTLHDRFPRFGQGPCSEVSASTLVVQIFFLQASERVKELRSADNCWVQRPLALQCSSNQHSTSTLRSGLGQEVRNTAKLNSSNSAFGEVESNYRDFGQNICLDDYALAKMLWDLRWEEVVRILVRSKSNLTAGHCPGQDLSAAVEAGCYLLRSHTKMPMAGIMLRARVWQPLVLG